MTPLLSYSLESQSSRHSKTNLGLPPTQGVHPFGDLWFPPYWVNQDQLLTRFAQGVQPSKSLARSCTRLLFY